MAVATSAAIIGGVIAAGGLAKTISGAKRSKALKDAQQNFKRQELKNVNEGRRISTLGADLAREESARGLATSVDALRSGGIRGVVGGSQGLQEAQNTNARRIGAGLDQQQVALDREVAADEARIRDMRERRDNAELNALQQQRNAAQQDIWSGVGDITGGLTTIAGGMGGGSRPPVQNVSSIAPAGVVTPASPNGIVAPVFRGK